LNIPRHFNKEFYDLIESFLGARLVFKPPHARGYMDDSDHIYTPINFFDETFVTNEKTMFISSPRFGMITINFNSKHLDVQGD
jgi:hypothetical protein